MDDPNRSRRQSTIQKTERLKELELKRKEVSNSKKSKAEKKLVDETSLIEVAALSAKRNIAIEERGAVGGKAVKSNSEVKRVDDEEVFEEPEEDFDPLGEVKSPNKREPVRKESLVVAFTRKRSQDPDNWSIQVNQFFPSNCVISPPYLSPAYQGNPETWSFQNQFFPPNCVQSPRFPSPNQNLMISAEVHERGVDIDTRLTEEVLQLEHFPSKMDENEFKTKFLSVRKEFAKVDRKLKLFGPADVTLEDKDSYKADLFETRRLLDNAPQPTFVSELIF